VTVPLLDLQARYAPIRDEIRAAIDRVLDSQNFIPGPEVEGLEREIVEYSQCREAVGGARGRSSRANARHGKPWPCRSTLSLPKK
jgi:dTDP-4-amino-4,6-dideoxygalactose transaminase